ncbi:NERD domain-containing protein [Streptomyces sp. NPDC003077]|uniref:nuclease-related domain-containing DEAD/DEAH box helicase n=1 Tax=Streptomyces sp. NPDC003077 TaxID=3154443 RepID=UPI0033B2CD8D
MAAGDSASRRAEEARRLERSLHAQWQAARREARRWEAAGEAERRVAALLLVLTEHGWRLLVDRRWPGTRAANVDMLLIGPAGVFVVDVKNWRSAPRVRDGRLYAGHDPRDAEARKLMAVTRTAEDAVASLGLSPVAVRPLLVFAGWRGDAWRGRVRLLGERDAGPALLAEPGRLRPAEVGALAAHLARVFPEYEGSAVPSVTSAEPGPEGQFDAARFRDAVLAAARRAPIEQWMTFLHPDQLPLVRRDWAGPARISGPTGTGKTVVGLHRAARLAQSADARILYVTYANNLPRVQATFLREMAPDAADRVDFRSLHAWAHEFLAARGVPTRLHRRKAETAFSLAWARVGRGSRLAEIDPTPRYWREEIDHVIKGRGITTFTEYAAVPRRRRRAALARPHREAVWTLYQAYERLRAARGVHDFNDILALALKEARDTPGSPYGAVIADEVQDLTLVGVRLLYALVGDAPNGLLLIGDGQQAVQPGGFRLTEAGLDIRGDRAQVLRTNYRNARQILDAALAVVAGDAFEDIDGVHRPGRREVGTAYHGGRVLRVTRATEDDHDRALLGHLRALPSGAWADTAVLCPTTRVLAHQHKFLAAAGIPVCLLEQYDGHPVPAVKLGSYRRAKGLEFKHVCLPCHDEATTADGAGDGTGDGDEGASGTAAERAELARSRLFVAMTRARDTLWLGSVRGRGGDDSHEARR